MLCRTYSNALQTKDDHTERVHVSFGFHFVSVSCSLALFHAFHATYLQGTQVGRLGNSCLGTKNSLP